MTADVLATQEARASANMILTKSNRDTSVPDILINAENNGLVSF